MRDPDPLATILGYTDSPFSVHLHICDTCLTLKTNSPHLAELLQRYFAGWLTPHPCQQARVIHAIQARPPTLNGVIQVSRASGSTAKEVWYDLQQARVVVKKRTGIVVATTGTSYRIVGDLTANFNQTLNVVNDAYVEGLLRRGFIPLHASAVVDARGHAVALCSPSGTGKTSAALALLDRGFRFLSNDRVLAKREAHTSLARGLPKKPRVNPGTLLAIPRLASMLTVDERDYYSSLSPHHRWQIEHKLDIDVDQVYREGTFVLEAPLGRMCLLDWTEQDQRELSLTRLEVDQALCLLRPLSLDLDLSKTVLTTLEDRYVLSQLAALCRHAQLYHITGAVHIARLAALVSAVCDTRPEHDHGPGSHHS